MKRRPHDSSLRDAFVGVLMTVGPFFGVRYKPPQVEVPVVTTPGQEDDTADTLTSAPRLDHSSTDDDADAGIVI
ncbi:MAG: hypothetical protein ACRDQZ_26085 [Mycobacteriales bacterium]